MLLVLALIIGLGYLPLLLGTIAFAGSAAWPEEWLGVAGTVGGLPTLVFLGMIGASIVSQGEGEIAAVLAIFMFPFFAWYLAFIWGGAFLGRRLGLTMRPTGTREPSRPRAAP